MTKIAPFRAITYNQEKIKDLSRIVCPPYDVISAHQQQYYYDLSPYNFIHILLGKDTPGEDKYLRARNYLKDWLKNKILLQEERPAFYFSAQEYLLKGERKIRLGLIGRLHLQDNNSSIFCHEHTHLEPKEDRLKLLKAVKANLSPIFVLFYDKKRLIQYIYQHYIKDSSPFIDITDESKIVNKLWRLNSPEALSSIQEKISSENIFIADGHHRYEVALAYRNQMKKKVKYITGEEDFNYVLAYFTDIESKGLTILSVHRLVKLESGMDMEVFSSSLKNYFNLEEIKDKNRFFFLMERAGQTEHILGMYKAQRYWLLRLKNIKILDRFISDKPKEYRTLDISILNYIILRNLLGIDLEDKQRIAFSPSADELIENVDSHTRNIAFFLNAAKVSQIISVALTGERMPPKSTYFYPKVLSGLVINKFNEDKS